MIEIPESSNYILDVIKADERDLNFLFKELRKIERLIERCFGSLKQSGIRVSVAIFSFSLQEFLSPLLALD